MSSHNLKLETVEYGKQLRESTSNNKLCGDTHMSQHSYKTFDKDRKKLENTILIATISGWIGFWLG